MEPQIFTHLPLPLVKTGKPKRSAGARASDIEKDNKANRVQHSQTLVAAAERIVGNQKRWLDEREEPEAHPMPAGVPLLLKTEPDIDLDFLRNTFNFEVVAESEEGFVMVASEDVDLTRFIAQASAFATEVHGSAPTAKVYELVEDGDDRTGRLKRILSQRLFARWGQFEDDQLLTVDLSVACTGTTAVPEFRERRLAETDDEFAKRMDRYKKKLANPVPGLTPREPRRRTEESLETYAVWLAGYRQDLNDWWAEFDALMMQREGELTTWVESYDGLIVEQTNEPDFPDSFLIRATLPFKGLKDIVYNHPHLFEATEPEEIFLVEDSASFLDPSIYPQLEVPLPDSPLVAIVDSGIQEAHPLLEQAIEPTLSKSFVPGDAGVSDLFPPHGHGTRVAGASLYRSGISPGTYRLPFRVANIRILDQNAELHKDLVSQDYIGKVVAHLAGRPDVKIFNHSVSSYDAFEKARMSAWAAAIDLVSYENDVLFVQAAGNLKLNDPTRNSRSINHYLWDFQNYPEYLLEDGCRIADPGQSFQALTVGSVSPSQWVDGDRRSMGGRQYPSAFSSTGPGIWGCVKPDVVEVGGCISIDNGVPPTAAPHDNSSVELLRTTIQPGALSSREGGYGTSFATPRVSGLLAEIQRLLPNEPALLYRAILANAARWPEWAENDKHPENILRFLGFGVPSEEHALHSTDYRVTLISQGLNEIGGSEAHIFRIPIPESLRHPSDESLVRLDVTLSYSARPKRTRRNARGYLSTWLEWKSACKGESYDSFAARIVAELEGTAPRDSTNQIPWMLRERAEWGILKGAHRGVGTLQKDWALLSAHELPADLCVAVLGHKGWDKNSEDKAKYAIAVTVESVNHTVELYTEIETAIQTVIQLPAVEVEL